MQEDQTVTDKVTISSINEKIEIQGKKEELNSYLLEQSKVGLIPHIQAAIDAGADVNYQEDNTTPLLAALRNAQLEVAKLLVEKGAKTEFKCSNFDKTISVYEAAMRGGCIIEFSEFMVKRQKIKNEKAEKEKVEGEKAKNATPILLVYTAYQEQNTKNEAKSEASERKSESTVFKSSLV